MLKAQIKMVTTGKEKLETGMKHTAVFTAFSR